jgi:L-lactate dehydrogenase complex protein LldG
VFRISNFKFEIRNQSIKTLPVNTSSRETIFENLRRATASIAEKEPAPEYDDALLHAKPRLKGKDPLDIFIRNFTAASGVVVRSIPELAEFLRKKEAGFGFCDARLFNDFGRPLFESGFSLGTGFEREQADRYDFAMTPATAGIAESGSLVLDDDTTSDRLAAVAPWIHVAVLQASDIVETIPDGLARLGGASNVIWVTGPSKTSDVEGILIEGVHGPGIEVALVV